MQVILTADVKGKGKKGDVVKVSDGYANNFLIKKGLAVTATNENMNVLNNKKQAEEHKKEVIYQEAVELKNKINDKVVSIVTKVGEGGKLFGAITTIDIANAIKKDLKEDIDKRKIQLKDNLKNEGRYEVEIKLHKDVTAKVIVNIKS